MIVRRKIQGLYRYPVKGLSPEKLAEAPVRKGRAFANDRVFAIAHGKTSFDRDRPAYLEKQHFLMLASQPRLAELHATFNEVTGLLTLFAPDGAAVSGNPETPAGGALINGFLEQFAGDLSLGGLPRLVFSGDHRFFDIPEHYLSLINLSSIQELGSRMETRLDPLRFRANIYYSGGKPREEEEWTGRSLRCGDVRIRVQKPIERCAATNVNRETAEVDLNIPWALRKHFGHRNMGVYVEVEKGGRLAEGMELTGPG